MAFTIICVEPAGMIIDCAEEPRWHYVFPSWMHNVPVWPDSAHSLLFSVLKCTNSFQKRRTLIQIHRAQGKMWHLTDADDVHEAVHAIADLEKQVLSLPASRRAERWPHQPGDTGHQEQGSQDGCCYLHFLYHCQGDGLPLQEDTDLSDL